MENYDIVPELLEKILEEYENKVGAIKSAELFGQMLESNNLEDAYEFARQIGGALSESFAKYLTEGVLPNGRMYYNIASRIIPTSLKKAYQETEKLTEIIMANILEKSKIGIAVQKATINADRITGIVERLSEAESFSDVKFLTGNAVVENVTQSAVDDVIETNATFHYKSGLKAVVERRLGGRCCEWCSNLVGRYSYPNVPGDVYRRHENCRCTVTYYPSKTSRGQDVWSKSYKSKSLHEYLNQHEDGKKVFINDQAIKKVKKTSIPGLTDEENMFLKSTHADLLDYSRTQNFSNEVGCIVQGTERINFVKGTINECNLEFDPDAFHWLLTRSNLTVCHNHPGLSDFSLEDIEFFIRYQSIKRMTIVTNTRHVKYLVKKSKYEFDNAKNLLLELKEINSSKKYIVDNFLKKAYSIGIERGR